MIRRKRDPQLKTRRTARAAIDDLISARNQNYRTGTIGREMFAQHRIGIVRNRLASKRCRGHCGSNRQEQYECSAQQEHGIASQGLKTGSESEARFTASKQEAT